MGNEFLYKEYELSYEQLRFYDQKHSTLQRFVFTLCSSVATALFAILKFIGSPTTSFYQFQSLISFLLFVATLICYLSLIQNRLYFVFVARQLNSLRGHFLDTEAQAFRAKNQMYTSTDFPAAKWSSLHTLQFISVSIVSALFGSIAVYSLNKYYCDNASFCLAIAAFIVLLFAEVFGGFIYLKTKGSQKADTAVHVK